MPPAASPGRASTSASGASRTEQPNRTEASLEPPAAAPARLAAAKQLLCSHWDSVSKDTQSAFAIGKPASSDKMASKRCAVASACCELALCSCSCVLKAVQVLSSLALAQPKRAQHWLLSGMSPLATEVLTTLLEGWQDLPSTGG